ncbi:MAG: type II secretion system F family protein [Actinomycetota bacterium]
MILASLFAVASGICLGASVVLIRDRAVIARVGVDFEPTEGSSETGVRWYRSWIPSLAGASAARARTQAADAELPQLFDAIAACSAAGLATPLALRRSVEAIDGPLAEEVQAAMQSIDLGRRWRDELGALADRLQLADLRRAVATLRRSEVLGASLAKAINGIADQVRAARRDRASERARRAPVKMLFPLVFLVLPAFLLLTVVPVLLSTLRSID